MKVTEISVSAVIPTGQYANIQPKIVISEVDNVPMASQMGVEWIKEHFERFSEKGMITDKEVIITAQKKSPLTKMSK